MPTLAFLNKKYITSCKATIGITRGCDLIALAMSIMNDGDDEHHHESCQQGQEQEQEHEIEIEIENEREEANMQAEEHLQNEEGEEDEAILASLKEELAQAFQVLHTKNETICQMQSELDGLRHESDQLVAENDELLDDMDGILAENEDLKNKVENAKQKVITFVTANNELKARRDVLLTQLKFS